LENWFKIVNFNIKENMGIGDWGLGIGPNPQSPIPNPQSPIPNDANFFITEIFPN